MKHLLRFSLLKPLVMVAILVSCGQQAYLQNVGINTPDPKARLQVTGSFMVSSAYKGSTAEPTPDNQLNMINGQPIRFENDSVARFYDPGGESGSYLPNLNAQVVCSTYTNNYFNAYLEITIESLQLGTGDSLIISEFGAGIFYRIGNATIGAPIVLHSGTPQVNFLFKSNSDASVGQGFSVKVRTMYPDNAYDPNINRSGYGIAYHSSDQSLRFGTLNQQDRGARSIVLGPDSRATADRAIAIGSGSTATGSSSIALGSSARTENYEAVALGSFSTADGPRSIAIGVGSTASGNDALALGGGLATGSRAVAIGDFATSEGTLTTAIGPGTRAKSRSSVVVGSYNVSYASENPTSWVELDPLFVVGNGVDYATRSNAFSVRKNGRIGIGTDFPATDVHIRQGSGGGLMLENGSDNNKWRIYSASGDNNLTFYNNANTEIADIDDVTGTFSAISDARLKKNITPLGSVLALVKQLAPTTYHFNWQQPADEKQIGMLAQEAYKLFPQLVSYDKEKDLYKMNYAGFSTVAIAAIQEQQVEIDDLKKRLLALEEKLSK